MEQIPEHIESIMFSLFSGTANDDEVALLREWLDASEENKKILEKYQETNYWIHVLKDKDPYDATKAWSKIRPLLREKTIQPKNNYLKWFYRAAAIFVIAFLAGMATMYLSLKPEPELVAASDAHITEYSVPYGSKAKIVLPDSSSIWINAGSTLRYTSDFNVTNREVFVEGEAYFQVAKNPEKPFFVRTGTVALKVLGTSFNLKAYPEENSIETTVETGIVQILNESKDQIMGELFLTAGQKATVIKSSVTDKSIETAQVANPTDITPIAAGTIAKIQETVVSKNVQTELYTSWKDSRWLIEKESLDELAVKLERRFNVRISFDEDQLKKYSFTGTLEDETLEQVLEIIKLSAPIDFKVKQNKVKLSRNKWINNSI